MKPDVILLSHAHKQLEGTHSAKNLYISPQFKLKRKYAELYNVPIYVLSPKYGIVSFDDPVSFYDWKKCKFDLRDSLWKSPFENIIKYGNCKSILVLAGKNYIEIITKLSIFHNITILNPLRGLPIGKRMQLLKNKIENYETS